MLSRFDAAHARQAVAVDELAFYAIDNSAIGKYDKRDGRLLGQFVSSSEQSIEHLNSGVVFAGQLYCANSNYPQIPERSSVEIFDTESLKHIATHDLGHTDGSLTWIDRHRGSWWAVFAHYTKLAEKDPRAKPTSYTTLVKLDLNWQPTEGWTFPEEVLERFGRYSCSGGVWGFDGRIYCTGHDRAELYCLELPKSGNTLVLDKVIPIDIRGQGIAWDKRRPGVIYGIDRAKRQVVVSKVQAIENAVE